MAAPADAVDWQRKLSLALEHSPTSVVVTGLDGIIQYVNPHFTQVSGYTADEAIGRNPRILQSGKTPPEVFVDLWSTVTKGEVWHGELVNRRKDGVEYVETASIAPILGPDGTIAGYVGIKEDVTGRKLTELRLRETVEALERTTALAEAMAAKAEAANAAKGQFLANMSHEIRTPMNGVIGMTSLLLDTDLDEEQRRYAETVQSSAESLLALLNDLLDFSRIEAGRLELESVDFDPRSLVEEVAESLISQVRARKIVFECSASDSIGASVRGDPGRLRQVLINLIGNAVKFTREGSVRARLDLQSETESVSILRFSVSDTGIGIPPEKQERLFHRFSQVDASNTREFGGTGLGLAISKQLVELMGGEIGVTSPAPRRDGKADASAGTGPGSEFWFTIRLAKIPTRSDASAPSKTTSPRKTPPANRMTGKSGIESARILVVEDNIINQQVACGILRKLGAHTSAATNGLEAIQLLTNLPFDLVLMDVQMPEMDGLAATRLIRDPHSTVLDHALPVLGLSAGTMNADIERGLAAGMDDYVAKPVDPWILADVVEKWLHRGAIPPPHSDASQPVETSSLESPPVFDREGLVDRLLGDVDLARTIAAMFREDIPGQILSLKGFLDEDDAAGVERTAHTIKGSAGNVCGHALQAFMRTLESAATAGDLESVRNQIHRLDPMVDLLCGEMAEI